VGALTPPLPVTGITLIYLPFSERSFFKELLIMIRYLDLIRTYKIIL
jgi:hypothetical protein